MIHSSARNADHAKTLAGEAQASASLGNTSLEAMAVAMGAIEKSSNEVVCSSIRSTLFLRVENEDSFK
jgi:methyl-accepting chemotaxis protein